ncbi:centrosomal protein 192kDa L homeolog isoform X2 [Xenopus laevis]|uniref:Centrosomal protein 192kDa L homeolog isoform X2 n=1 Tax=Xenopus laevis TaxID=8355 RepID=A0A8J1KVQ3_XENLA|nr:centrosomal protein 192kDa L homeolog isoform X2 [Xenopus laevis]
MTERFFKIEDETFPSFLGESLNSNSGGALENCTLSSNLGLPVAASTVAKARPGFDWTTDAQESYLEANKLQDTLLHLTQSNGDAQRKFMLSFKDELEPFSNIIGNQNQTVKLSESDRKEKRSSDSEDPHKKRDSSSTCTLPRTKQIGKASKLTNANLNAMKENEDLFKDDLSKSVTSFLENEKLLSIASLEGSSSDDLDDEEFYDDHLEAYFKKLLPHGMQRGVIEGQEITEPKRLSHTALSRNDTRPCRQDSDKLQFLEDYEEAFQMLDVRLAATGMDSAPASDDEDVEHELEKAALQHLQREQFLVSVSRHCVGEQNRPSFRPGLEGGSSDDDSSNELLPIPSRDDDFPSRQSADGRVLYSPKLAATSDKPEFGDGSSGSDDGQKNLQTSQGQGPVFWNTDVVARNVAGEEDRNNVQPSQIEQMEDRIDPVGRGATLKDRKTTSNSPERSSVLKSNINLEVKDSSAVLSSFDAEPKLDSLYFRNDSMNSVQLSTLRKEDEQDIVSLSQMFSSNQVAYVHPISSEMQRISGDPSKASYSIADTYLSPSYKKDCPDSSTALPPVQDQPFSWSFGPTGYEADSGNTAHSVVYRNEEGKWVTDLAYYKPFDHEHGASFSGLDSSGVKDEDFIVGTPPLSALVTQYSQGRITHNHLVLGAQFPETLRAPPASKRTLAHVDADALAMIQEDQNEFEEEHRFIQEEKMDLDNCSHNMAETSWKIPVSTNVLLKTSPEPLEDASYLRLSLGEFFGQRSEALGCLGGGQDVKRPSFGYHIISPEKQEPVALLSKCDLSRDSEHEDTIKFYDDTLTQDLECLPDAQKLASATFDLQTPKSKAGGNRPASEKLMNSQTSTVEELGSIKVHCKQKQEETSDSMLLSISTIATAIANASCSADPKQLAAMIMALSNKNKNTKLSLVSSEPSETSTDGTCNVGSSVDMERYLKVTKLNGRKSEPDHPLNTLTDFSLDMSQKCKQTLLDSIKDHSNITDLEKQDLKRPDSNENQGSQSLQPLLTSDKANISTSGTLLSESKIGLIKTSPMSASNQNSFRTSEKGRASNGNLSKDIQNDGPNFTPNLSKNKAQMQFTSTMKEGGQMPHSTQKQDDLKSLPNDTKIFKSPRSSASCLSNSKYHSAAKESKKICAVASQKHVSFQPPDDDLKGTDAKVIPDHHALPGMEEEQFSFRPSTSPLIHSSPSQDSLKISADQGSSLSPSGAGTVQAVDNDALSPESSCFSPSLSRLTYISVAENTVQNITASPDNQSDNTIELSTTIVRSSPTPLEMQNNIQKDKLSWQQQKCKALGESPQKQKNQSGFSSAASINFSGKTESLLQQDKKLEPTGHIVTYDKMSAINYGLPSNLSNYFSAAPLQTDSLNVLPGSALGNYSAVQNLSNKQFAPVSGFKPVAPSIEVPNLPAAVPGLHNGQLLSTSEFAPQYLESVTAVGNAAMPQYRVGTSAVYGHHVGYPSSAVQALQLQSAVSGIPLNTNTAGLLATLPMSNNHTSIGQNVVVPTNVYPLSSVGTNDIPQWSARMSSDFGQVLVPSELTFPSACCIGIASQASLNIFNPNERWLQVNIGILSVAVNGEKVDIAAYQYLVFKNKIIIGPRAAEDLKILFLPQREGLFQCVLSVSSWPVSADAETIRRSEAVAAKVFLTAVSENPSIEVDTGKTGCLDFGDVASGSWKTLPLKIINRIHATLPIRLIISANATAWRCFMFSKDPANFTDEYSHVDLMAKMSSPSVISHVMHASYDGQEPETLIIWVVFHSPQTLSSAGPLGPAEEFIARVDVEVDSPGPAFILKSVPLRARVGCARIHAPKDLQTVQLISSVGSFAKQLLPLKNAGNIAVHLKVKSSNSNSNFSVDPEELFLMPGEEQVVAIHFTPRSTDPEKSILKITVQPSGPQYEVTVIGETEKVISRNPLPVISADVPPILSNKQFVSWGGVSLGRAVQQKLILRNTSTSSNQYLRLLIRGQDQDCFQLQSTFGTEERLTNNRELIIRPKEDSTIYLMFSPTRVGCMLAKLEIKQSGMKSSQPGIKFTIPLSGYGGTSNLVLEDLKKLSDSYMVKVGGISSGQVSKVSFCVKNTGTRAAYVKVVCFADFHTSVTMDPNVMNVYPEKFVLKERSQETITVSCRATKREESLCQTSTALISTVCLFCGDEVARQQFRRALLHKPEIAQKVISENTLLKNTRFDEEFPGEQQISEVYDLPQRPNDIQLFYANMHKMIVSVVGNVEASIGGDYQTTSNRIMDSAILNTERNMGNTSLDVLPVKGPQGPNFAKEPPQDSVSTEDTWSVQPECLFLTAPSVGGVSGTGHIKFQNCSARLLRFDLSWPAHCLTITPQHGTVEPKSYVLILVSPNPSLNLKQTLLPWNGQIYVHCDSVQKCIKVQINEDSALSTSTSTTKPRGLLSPHPDTPVHIAKPFTKSPSTKVEIKNRTLMFPKTAAGESSETFLEIENPGDEDLKWLLTSFAPPYVKGVNPSGEVYRATYTAFRCSRVSGVLAAHENLKVAIHFFPRDKGDYAQFWDLECYPVSLPHLKHKVRFQLCGECPKEDILSDKPSAASLIKTEASVKPRRRSGSEASSLKALHDAANRGVYASEELYTFPNTFVGESSTLKVNLQNNSFNTFMLKFVSPKDPFHLKHSKYSLRAHHYINLPVKFKPTSAGRYEGILDVQTDAGNISIRLVGEALAK